MSVPRLYHLLDVAIMRMQEWSATVILVGIMKCLLTSVESTCMLKCVVAYLLFCLCKPWYVCRKIICGSSIHYINCIVLMCTATNIRLVGGAKSSSFHSGRVEVFINGQWGTVCDDFWDSSDARVVCRQLGYTSGTAYGGAVYGQGSGQIWLDDLSCYGYESSLLNCGHRGTGSHNCWHGEDASVVCYNGEPIEQIGRFTLISSYNPV